METIVSYNEDIRLEMIKDAFSKYTNCSLKAISSGAMVKYSIHSEFIDKKNSDSNHFFSFEFYKNNPFFTNFSVNKVYLDLFKNTVNLSNFNRNDFNFVNDVIALINKNENFSKFFTQIPPVKPHLFYTMQNKSGKFKFKNYFDGKKIPSLYIKGFNGSKLLSSTVLFNNYMYIDKNINIKPCPSLGFSGYSTYIHFDLFLKKAYFVNDNIKNDLFLQNLNIFEEVSDVSINSFVFNAVEDYDKKRHKEISDITLENLSDKIDLFQMIYS